MLNSYSHFPSVLSCDVMVIQDIQEVSQYMELKFRITMQWVDARVTYYNIKEDENMNSLSLDEQLSLWNFNFPGLQHPVSLRVQHGLVSL